MPTITASTVVKSFPSHLANRVALISDSVVLSHAPSVAARQWLWGSASHGVPVYLPPAYTAVPNYTAW